MAVTKMVHKLISKNGGVLWLPPDISEGLAKLSNPQLYSQSAVQLYPLGTLYEIDFRKFRYAHIASVSNAGRGFPGFDYDDPTELGTKVGAQVAGASSVLWTVVGASVAADAFAGGYILLRGGFVRRIKSNTYNTIGLTITLTLQDDETIPETIAAGRYGILKRHPYANVITRQSATGQKAAHCVGVPTFDMTAGYYGWLQTKGYCGVIATPATLGDTMAEQAMVANQVGAEVSVEAVVGYQVIGHSTLFDQINWDSENFMILDLCIER